MDHTRTHTHIRFPTLWTLSGTTRVNRSRKVKRMWIYWSKR